MKRIDFLDGLRGLAIIAVVLYHAYDRYVPVDAPGPHPFRFGFLGVSLFFLISGFVILLSLEKTKNYFTFLFHRWRRLFPAMLVASVLLFASAFWLRERPLGIPHTQDLIPGLFFVDPHILNFFFKNMFHSIEGSFWSLYVEVKFYIIFGALFFFMGRNKALLGLVSLYLIYAITFFISLQIAEKLHKFLGLQSFCWFVGGCCMYLFYVSRDPKYVLFSVLIIALESVRMTFGFHFKFQCLANMVTLAIFIMPVYFENLRSIFANRILIFFGSISYPLYLIHENAIVALGIKLKAFFNGNIPAHLIPIIPIAGLVLIAFLIAKFAEPALKKLIDKLRLIS
jgi:peptidoglycan/LPS O-acetylase OafA/YrhL